MSCKDCIQYWLPADPNANPNRNTWAYTPWFNAERTLTAAKTAQQSALLQPASTKCKHYPMSTCASLSAQ